MPAHELDDSSYDVELSWAESVTTEAGERTLTGTSSGSGSLGRSFDNPLVMDATMYETIDGVLTAPEGTPEPIRIDRVVHVLTTDT